jgi:hypothetical protein
MAEEGGQRLAAFLAKERAGLAARGEILAQAGGGSTGVFQAQARGGGHRGRRPLGQALLVVLEQQPPGARVALDHFEHGLPLARDERVGGEGAGQELDRLLDLAETARGQAAFVQRVAAQEVVAQGTGGPDAELGAAAGVDAVADREDGVEVEELDLSDDFSLALP